MPVEVPCTLDLNQKQRVLGIVLKSHEDAAAAHESLGLLRYAFYHMLGAVGAVLCIVYFIVINTAGLLKTVDPLPLPRN